MNSKRSGKPASKVSSAYHISQPEMDKEASSQPQHVVFQPGQEGIQRKAPLHGFADDENILIPIDKLDIGAAEVTKKKKPANTQSDHVFQPGNLEGKQASAPLQNLAEDDIGTAEVTKKKKPANTKADRVFQPGNLEGEQVSASLQNLAEDDIGTAEVTKKKKPAITQADHVFQPGSLEGGQASAPLQNMAEDENTLIPLANMNIGTTEVTKKKKTTPAMKKAIDLIHQLCEDNKFSHALRDEMVDLLMKIESPSTRPLKVYACACVFIIALQRFDQGKIVDQPTLFKISAKAGIQPSQISKARTKIEGQITLGEKKSAREGSILGEGGTLPLPKFEVLHPVTGEDATERVKTMALTIVKIVGKLTPITLEHTSTSIAAASLAYQSLFFHESKSTSKKMSKLGEFVNVTGATNIHKRVTKKASLIRNEFTRLADKMLEQGMLKRAKNEAVTHFLARNLGEILKHEEKICRMVLEEANALAEGDDDDDYNPPIELTKEEKEKLAAEELCDDDLSNEEFQSYLLLDDVRQFKKEHVLPVMMQYLEKQELKREKRMLAANKKGPGKKAKNTVDVDCDVSDDSDDFKSPEGEDEAGSDDEGLNDEED